jgi:rRNA maturation RNase YbeY
MISFNNEDKQFNLKNKTKLKSWVVKTIESKRKKAGDISFVFCSDAFLLEMNKEYLNHDTYTDIITFDYSKDDSKQPISGDIFISVDRVQENADKFSKTFEDELHRVIIHGVLHLLGYKDKTKIAKTAMTKQEDLCLKALKKA